MVSESKKERWKEQRDIQRQQFTSLEKKRRVKRILIWAIVIIAAAAIAFFVYKKTSGPGKYDTLARCMTEHGMTMYGTDWCPHCQRQKQLFGKSFQYINYVNCDLGDACNKAGVQSYPTWAKDGQLFPPGVKSLAELTQTSGCEMP